MIPAVKRGSRTDNERYVAPASGETGDFSEALEAGESSYLSAVTDRPVSQHSRASLGHAH